MWFPQRIHDYFSVHSIIIIWITFLPFPLWKRFRNEWWAGVILFPQLEILGFDLSLVEGWQNNKKKPFMPQWIACKVWTFSDTICLKAINKHNNGLHHVDHVLLLLLFNHKYYSHQWLYYFDFAATICLQHLCWLQTSTPLSWLLPPSSLPSKTCFPYWLSSVWRHTHGLKTQTMLWQVVPPLHKFLGATWESNTVVSILIPPFLIFYTLFQDAPFSIQFFVFIMLLCATCCNVINRLQFDYPIFLSYASNYQRCCWDPMWYIGQCL